MSQVPVTAFFVNPAAHVQPDAPEPAEDVEFAGQARQAWLASSANVLAAHWMQLLAPSEE